MLDAAAWVQFFGSLTRGLVARPRTMGGPPPGGLPIAMVAAGSPVHATGVAQPLCDGDAPMPFRFLSVPVTLPLTEIVDRLNTLQTAGLFGYPSVLARLAGERKAGRLRIAPVMVTCTSETCGPELVTNHPLVIRSVLVRSPDVLEYQVHQTPTGIDVTAVAEPALDVAGLRARFETALTAGGLAAPEVVVRAAPNLERDPATRKLRLFVPLR